MPHQGNYGLVEQQRRQPIAVPGGTPPFVPEGPGNDIAQGAPADIGSLSPIVQLIKLIMGGMGQGQQPAPTATPSLRNSMITQPPRRPEDVSGMGY